MKKKPIKATEDAALRSLADAVGDFIRYWGFRRAHGKIWTHIYLSNEPLSAVELTKSLKISKALASLALKELVEYGLISFSYTDGKTKKYQAADDIFEVIREILTNREKVLIEKAKIKFDELQRIRETTHQSTTQKNRMATLSDMIESADIGINLLLVSDKASTEIDWITMFHHKPLL
jgi:DNA-binding transcriptional regulator GbsR (MarR family)